MKAVQVQAFGEPDVMAVQPVEAPAPGEKQVVVAIGAAGVNPVDTYIRAGLYGRLPTLPYIPGIDAAGTVAAVGPGVKTVQVGDRVYGGWPISGTYAEMALYEANQVYPLSAQISFAQGAGVFVPYSTAYRGLFIKGQARLGETVLVHGATGGVGLAAVQLAVGAGLRVIATGGTAAGRLLVQQQGADLVLDHHAPDYRQQILEATQQRGVDVILEMLANVNLGDDLTFLNQAGRVVVIGSRGDVAINPRDLMGREAIVTGFTLFNTPSTELTKIQMALQMGLSKGSLVPVVRQELLLSEAARAHRLVMASGAQGNIVLTP